MSNHDINRNLDLVKLMIENEKKECEKYYTENPDALSLKFCNELRELGYEFEVPSQTKGFMPKHRATILPIAISYYQQAKGEEKNFFLSFFHHKGLEEVVLMLIEDFYLPDTKETTRWFISDCLYQICSSKYIDEYLKIIANPEYGRNRQMIVLLVGKLKAEKAVPILINLLDYEEIRSQAIVALGNFKREEFRLYFEQFENSTNSYWRRYAKAALKKLR